MFISFVGIVALGIGHGLILLAVLLATFGPEDVVSMSGSSSSGDSSVTNDDAIGAELALIEDDVEVLVDDYPNLSCMICMTLDRSRKPTKKTNADDFLDIDRATRTASLHYYWLQKQKTASRLQRAKERFPVNYSGAA
jgi:hypothetical protein